MGLIHSVRGESMSNETTLTVPADRRLLPAILEFVGEYARAMGMRGRELNEIRLAMEEAVVNVIDHGYRGVVGETFQVELSTGTAGLVILIHEKGVPFDPEALEAAASRDGDSASPIQGLGLRILRRYMDEVGFRSLGAEGKQTRLVKRLCQDCVAEDEAEPGADEPSAPEDLRFTVRRMESGEALEVARLAYYAYGYTYSKLQIYDPAVIRSMNEQQTLVSFVAVTDEGEIMGHAALVHHEDSPLVPELGVAFVKPRFRRRGCMSVLTDRLVAEAHERKVHGLFAQGVCSHPYSQKALHKLGLAPCVLRLACAPFREYKGIEGAAGRESFITCHRYVDAGPGRPLFFPERHAEMLSRIFDWQGREISVSRTVGELKPPDGPLNLQVNMDSSSTVSLRLKRYGRGVVPEVRMRLRQACLERVDAVFLSLDLSDPLTARFTPEFEAMGFFFAGVMPSGGGRDHLILQYLNNVKLDFDALQAGNEKGRELVEYVRRCAEETEG